MAGDDDEDENGDENNKYYIPDNLKAYKDVFKKDGYTFTKDSDGSTSLTGGRFGKGDQN